MQLQEIAPGLWRWSAVHPEWEASPAGSPGDWEPAVGSVAYDAAGTIVLIDPLVTDGWDELDALVAGRPVAVLRTLHWHERSIPDAAARYNASREPPASVEAYDVGGAGETMYWLPAPRALVPGDRLVGDGAGGLRLCHESWLRYLDPRPTLDEVREALRPLLGLPVERVLVSHGEPVLADGHAAIENALA
jgi:hypothetical protein